MVKEINSQNSPYLSKFVIPKEYQQSLHLFSIVLSTALHQCHGIVEGLGNDGRERVRANRGTAGSLSKTAPQAPPRQDPRRRLGTLRLHTDRLESPIQFWVVANPPDCPGEQGSVRREASLERHSAFRDDSNWRYVSAQLPLRWEFEVSEEEVQELSLEADDLLIDCDTCSLQINVQLTHSSIPRWHTKHRSHVEESAHFVISVLDKIIWIFHGVC